MIWLSCFSLDENDILFIKKLLPDFIPLDFQLVSEKFMAANCRVSKIERLLQKYLEFFVMVSGQQVLLSK